MYLRFIGEDGWMGLTNGDIYKCEIHTSGRFIYVLCVYGVEFRQNCCEYSSIRKMLENWEEV